MCVCVCVFIGTFSSFLSCFFTICAQLWLAPSRVFIYRMLDLLFNPLGSEVVLGPWISFDML